MDVREKDFMVFFFFRKFRYLNPIIQSFVIIIERDRVRKRERVRKNEKVRK